MKQQLLELSVGRNAFWNGVVHQIIAQSSPTQWVLSAHGAPLGTPGVIVAKSQVQPVAQEVFQIGDAVASKWSLRGVVCGYEEGNGVVVRSDKTNTYDERWGKDTAKRVRWTYGVHELRHVEEVTLELNRTYTVVMPYGPSNMPVGVRVMQHASKRGWVTLYREDAGTLLGHVPQTLERDDLDKYGLTDILEV